MRDCQELFGIGGDKIDGDPHPRPGAALPDPADDLGGGPPPWKIDPRNPGEAERSQFLRDHDHPPGGGLQ